MAGNDCETFSLVQVQRDDTVNAVLRRRNAKKVACTAAMVLCSPRAGRGILVGRLRLNDLQGAMISDMHPA